jgi:hypothetical protein
VTVGQLSGQPVGWSSVGTVEEGCSPVCAFLCNGLEGPAQQQFSVPAHAMVHTGADGSDSTGTGTTPARQTNAMTTLNAR